MFDIVILTDPWDILSASNFDVNIRFSRIKPGMSFDFFLDWFSPTADICISVKVFELLVFPGYKTCN